MKLNAKTILRFAAWATGALVLLGVGGFLVAASGVMPIKASSGHWPITRWMLEFSMSRSVATHSVGIEPPPLEDPNLVLKGAGAFEIACRTCHGAPGAPRLRITREMTPMPPELSTVVPDWDREELFYIVKHGVKFTGMPAWPDRRRDDEVWAVTAFLLELPKLDAAEYRRLAYGPAAETSDATGVDDPAMSGIGAALDRCTRCHGADGLGRGNGAFPAIAGQKAAYLRASLAAYAADERHSGIMSSVAVELSPEEMDQLAEHFSQLPRSPIVRVENRQSIERGRQIAALGIPNERVPACSGCHGPSDQPKNPHYPLLDVQYPEYLALQLRLFRAGARGGTHHAHLMRQVAASLTDEQIRDAAAYFASLEASPEP